MSRSLMLLILGALVAVAPFSGLPLSILAWILPPLGLATLAIGLSYRTRAPRASSAHEAPVEASA